MVRSVDRRLVDLTAPWLADHSVVRWLVDRNEDPWHVAPRAVVWPGVPSEAPWFADLMAPWQVAPNEAE